jgi:CubicO group peptidase (beta-lactamase class C family)
MKPSADFPRTLACASGIACDALIVMQGGHTVLRLGDTERRYMCHSIRKSLLSALFGALAEDEPGLLGRSLAALGIDDKQGLSAIEKQATVHELLAARSGIYHPAAYETEWMRSIKPPRHSMAPGQNWCYSNWDFNALGTIYRQLSGRDLHAAFKEDIAGPTGMQDFRYDATHRDGELLGEACSDHAAYPFLLSARDLARFGQLYLQGGQWEGAQVLTRHWVDMSLLPYSHAGDRGAYGYMWWLARDGVAFPGVVLPTGSFHAFGAGGHYCVVMPALDMVVVQRVDTGIAGREVDRFQFGALLRAILQDSARPGGQP